jgi:hypothetical protein
VDAASDLSDPIFRQPNLRCPLSYANIPHVCFKVELPPTGQAADDVPRLLERHFRTRFDSARVMMTGPLAPLAVALQAGAKSFSVVLGRSKYEDGEWILLVGPPHSPSLLDRLLSRRPASDTPELMQLCREIHAMLTPIPGVTDIRWYFAGRNGQTSAFAAPDELPWA